MVTVDLNKSTGKESLELNEYVFGITPHQQALYDVVNAQRAAMRQGTHKTKTKSEVSGGGKKPWRQKGTGRARQGSTRSAQWVGGGILFGPTPRKYNVKLNRKVRRLALRSALSYHVSNNSLIVISELNFPVVKTKNVVALLDMLGVDRKALLLDLGLNENFILSARNVPYLAFSEADHASVYDILNCHKLILTERAVQYFEGVLKDE